MRISSVHPSLTIWIRFRSLTPRLYLFSAASMWIGRDIEGTIISEMGGPLGLQEMGSDGIDRHRVRSDDEPFVGPQT